MDTIIITDLEAIGHIGVKEDERAIPQVLLINFRAKANFSKAIKTDNVNDTNNYASIAKRIKSIVQETNFHLLEALGDHIMRVLFEEFDLDEITLRIEKPHRVTNTLLVGIEMTRKSKDYL